MIGAGLRIPGFQLSIVGYLATCLLAICLATTVLASEPVPAEGEFVIVSDVPTTIPAERSPTNAAALAARHARAGCPLAIAPWARATECGPYRGYYVGGSQWFRPWREGACDSGRCMDEGTWGRDFDPWYSRVELEWQSGRLYQGGLGQYEPDRRNWPFGLR